MIICIGPICIPLWGLLPFLAVYFWKLWDWLKVKLGYVKAQEEVKGNEKEVVVEEEEEEEVVVVSKKTTVIEYNEEVVSKVGCKREESPTGVIKIESEEHYQTLKTDTLHKGGHFVTKYTATWCQPCQAISPTFKQLANDLHATFVEVDIDEYSEIVPANIVKALPTFTIEHTSHNLKDYVGGHEDGLTGFLHTHLSPRKKKKD
eukprot:m.4863 g.4863  ORF g.4863 m.4863 type:complete len:204 (-) comp2302_c0_seq2:144-755(-)